MDSLLTSLGTLARFGIALVIVIVLIAVVFWLVRRFSANRTETGGRRGQRIGVVEYVNIDPQRRLVILRRDDVEHLVMIGGPNDVLVESGIGAQRVAAPAPAPELAVAPRRLEPAPAPAPAPRPVVPPPPAPQPVPVAPAPQAPTPPPFLAPQPAPQPAASTRVPPPRFDPPMDAPKPVQPQPAPTPATVAADPGARVTQEKLDQEMNSILGRLQVPPKT